MEIKPTPSDRMHGPDVSRPNKPTRHREADDEVLRPSDRFAAIGRAAYPAGRRNPPAKRNAAPRQQMPGVVVLRRGRCTLLERPLLHR